MDKKENVYGETMATGNFTEVNADAGELNTAKQEVPTVAGKFKDVDALVRAYESLQAEFTRRSQRLKELEKETENSGKESSAVLGRSGAEKLRKNAENRREKTKEFDEFVSNVNGAREHFEPVENGENVKATMGKSSVKNAMGTANGQVGVETTEQKEESAEKKNVGVGEEKAVAPSVALGNAPSSETLYAQVCRDEGVRLRIIGEYLSSVGKSAPPITAAGVGTFVSPPRKARNIGDAAAMALQYFKKP